jgi:hypothetical protein
LTKQSAHITLSSISTACDAIVAPNQTIGVSDAFGEFDIRAADGTPSGEDLGAMCGALSWQPQDHSFTCQDQFLWLSTSWIATAISMFIVSSRTAQMCGARKG